MRAGGMVRCNCVVHHGRRIRPDEQHVQRWDPDGTRYLALGVMRGGTPVITTDWVKDGHGPIKVECPECGEMNLIGPELLTPEHLH